MTLEDPEVERILRADAAAMEAAESHIVQYPPFQKLPPEAALRTLADYRKMLLGIGISAEEASVLIRNDMRQIAEGIRGLTANMPWLGTPRHAVLLHVALLLGMDAVRRMGSLWQALRERNYETASEELMLSDWPRLVGTEAWEKRRVLDLARVMRTGVLTASMVSPVHH